MRAVFVKQTARTVERIVVKKSWAAERTEEEAYFRPLLLRDGEVLAVLGEIKAVNTSNQLGGCLGLGGKSFRCAEKPKRPGKRK